MTINNCVRRAGCAVISLACVLLTPTAALAHCDGLDGPVVKAAVQALETRNATLVMIWVQPQDEGELKAVFDQTLAVRELSPQAKALADRLFFETVVRLHRAGEGAPFTGLKPAGRDLGPAIPAADDAVQTGSIDRLLQLLTRATQDRLREQFGEVLATKAFRADDVVAGRAHVKAYVEFIHFVERLHEATTKVLHGHFGESESSSTRR